jgi:predicted nucleotidyltransferase
MNFDLYSHTILLTRAGSRAYGVHTPTSDLDIKGVAIAPADYFLGLETFEQADKQEHFKDERFLSLLSEEEKEVVKASKLEGSVYELRKFLKLALDGNPNILDVLFCRDEDVLSWGQASTAPGVQTLVHLDQAASFATPGFLLREARDLFVSAKCKHTFSGYAFAQLKRINTHRRWILKPPTHKPTRAEFGLPESTLIPQDQLAAAEASVRKKIDSWELDLSTVPDDGTRIAIEERVRAALAEQIAGLYTDCSEADAKWRAAVKAVGIDDNLLLVMERERKYKVAKTEWDQYEYWKLTRNKDRAALEEKYHYDCKHGAHLVRLMRMSREVITTGKVNVWRGDIDADEIQAIRQGAWSYDKLIAFADAEQKAIDDIYDKKTYVVPQRPDRSRVNKLCVELLNQSLRGAR